jgi:hypothetical protein
MTFDIYIKKLKTMEIFKKLMNLLGWSKSKVVEVEQVVEKR